MNILVTGANGFVGKEVCQRLIKTDHHIIALSKSVIASNNIRHFEVTHFDRNTDFSDALNGVDVVIHLAGRAHVLHDKSENPYQAYAEVNIAATKNLALASACSGVKRFIFISSVKVNGEATSNAAFNESDMPNPEDDYGKTKYEAEKELRVIAANSNLEVVIIRPPLIYGKGVKANFKNLINLCQLRLPLPFGDLHNKRSMVYVENLVDFMISCITHPKAANETFLISDDEDVSTNELIQTIRQSLDIPALLIPIPQQWLVFFLSLIGKKSLSTRLCGNLQVDISKAKTLLGWKPPYSFKQGIQKTIHNN
ncbi:MAG: SDR family oxidoreductase [Methylophilus sp.]|nr:SDR family oxidoreductase [Methylophilus sp.]